MMKNNIIFTLAGIVLLFIACADGQMKNNDDLFEVILNDPIYHEFKVANATQRLNIAGGNYNLKEIHEYIDNSGKDECELQNMKHPKILGIDNYIKSLCSWTSSVEQLNKKYSYRDLNKDLKKRIGDSYNERFGEEMEKQILKAAENRLGIKIDSI